MNVMSSPRPQAVARPSARTQSKLKTRQKVLDAARRLFMERGYEQATIRDIAAAADLSTGAVFASFSDKTDLFNQVVAEDFERQVATVREAHRPEATVEDAIVALFGWAYEFHHDQLPLLQAAISLSWSQGLTGEMGQRPTYELALSQVIQILERGVGRDELPKQTDLRLTAEMLWVLYLSNYRRAVFAGWSVQQVTERLRMQARVVLAGARAISTAPS